MPTHYETYFEAGHCIWVKGLGIRPPVLEEDDISRLVAVLYKKNLIRHPERRTLCPLCLNKYISWELVLVTENYNMQSMM